MANLDGILKDPKIRGGKAVLEGTSMEVSRTIFYINGGVSEKDFLARFPHLSEEHLKAAKAYYKNNADEIDAEIYLIKHPEKELKNKGYRIIEEKNGIKRVVKN